MIKERYYQREAIEAAKDTRAAGGHPLIVMATGTGKTIVEAKLVQEVPQNWLWIAHMEELINQAVSKVQDVTGLAPGIEMDKSHFGRAGRIVCGSVQSVAARVKRGAIHGVFNNIITDEAHIMGGTYNRIYDHWSEATRFGFTATPYSKKRDRGLEQLYTKVAYEYPLHKAIKEGYLVPIKAVKVKNFDIDMSRLRIQTSGINAGDYDEKEVEQVIVEVVSPLCHNIMSQCEDRKTIVFAPTIDACEEIAGTLRSFGAKAETIHGSLDKDERRLRLYNLHVGKIQYAVTVQLLSTGFDEPSIEAIVNAAPTASANLYVQRIGRGTRLSPGKQAMLLIEFNYKGAPNLVKPQDIFAAKGYEERVRDKVELGEKAVDLMDALETAHEKFYSKEGILDRMIRRDVQFVTFDPFSFFDALGKDLTGEFNMQYEGRDLLGNVTAKQSEILGRYGFAEIETLTKAQASAMISQLFESGYKPMQGPATEPQIYALRRLGIDGNNMTKAQASMAIDIAKGGLRVRETAPLF